MDSKLFPPDLRIHPGKLLPDTQAINRQVGRVKAIIDKQPDSAFALCQDVLQKSITIDYNTGIGWALFGIGFIHNRKSAYDKSLIFIKQALRYSADDDVLTAEIYNSLGIYYQNVERNDSAVYYFSKGLNILREKKVRDPFLMAILYDNLISILAKTNPNHPYRKKYEQEMEQMLPGAPPNAKIIIIRSKAINYYDLKKYDSAIHYYKMALMISNSDSNHYSQGILLNCIGFTYIEANQPGKGIPYLLQAFSNPQIKNSQQDKVTTMLYLGYAYISKKEYGKAISIFKSALHTLENKQGKPNQLSGAVHEALAKAYTETGQYALAMKHLNQYVAVHDLIFNIEKENLINRLENEKQILAKNEEINQKKLALHQKNLQIKNKNLLIGGLSLGMLLLTVLFISLYRTKQHKQQLAQYKAMMEGEEKERVRLASELHDGIGGMLAAIKINLGIFQKHHSGVADVADLHRIMHMVEDTTTEVRKAAHNLLPDVLIRYSLVKALRIYCNNISKQHQLQIALQIYGDIASLDKTAELYIYRMSQELIQNILKHANAANALVTIMQQDKKLSITIEDDGCGFDMDNLDKGGFGLQNLQYRVQAFDGKISIRSTPGIGTNIHIEFDLHKLNKLSFI